MAAGRGFKTHLNNSIMKEKDLQTLFGRKNKVHGVFELKIVKGKSMPFSAVADHQVNALKDVSGTGLYHKISDASYDRKPFDCFFLCDTPAYVVPVWYVPRKRKTAYYIRIDTFLSAWSNSERKSLTEDTAKLCADYSIEL